MVAGMVVIDNSAATAMALMHEQNGVTTDVEEEQCHEVDATECCKNECSCCMVHFSPVPDHVVNSVSFSQSGDILRPESLPDPLTDRMIRPPRYI